MSGGTKIPRRYHAGDFVPLCISLPGQSVKIVAALSIDITQIIAVKGEGCTVAGPPPMVNNTFALFIQKGAAKHQRAALAALFAVPVSFLQLVGYITPVCIIVEYPAHLTLEFSKPHVFILV